MPTLGDLLYSAVDGAYAVDANQRIIYWDPGCEELFGHTANWVLGRPCCDVMCGKNPATDANFCKPECEIAKMASGERNGAPNTFSIKSKNKDGEDILMNVNVVLVPSPCKKGWIVMHLLNRTMERDAITAFDYALSNGIPPAKVSASGSSIGQDVDVTRLTKRELEVLQLLAEGISLQSISKRLSISLTTVRNHMQHIQKRLGVHSQTEAVAYAYRHNMVA
jgi:PAS domain S-box-containing protein